MFLGCPSVSACFRAYVRPTDQWTEFHQLLVDDVVEVTDVLNKFCWSMDQSQKLNVTHGKVKHFNELLLWVGQAINSQC